jgi:hypothetical protein
MMCTCRRLTFRARQHADGAQIGCEAVLRMLHAARPIREQHACSGQSVRVT